MGFREPIIDLLGDGLGSRVAVTSETHGFFRGVFLAERYAYDSFGTPRITGPGPDGQLDTADDVILQESALGNPFLFTGREYDPESGLYYYRSRYYDPTTGRFLQEDSFPRFLEDSQSFNRFSYAYNNPVNSTDPSGHFALVGAGVSVLEVLLIFVAAIAAYQASKQNVAAVCPLIFQRGESTRASGPHTEVGRKWKDLRASNKKTLT